MKLSEMIEEINPADMTYAKIYPEALKLRAIAIELAKACEGMIGGSVCLSSETTCGVAIARAKEILEGK